MIMIQSSHTGKGAQRQHAGLQADRAIPEAAQACRTGGCRTSRKRCRCTSKTASAACIAHTDAEYWKILDFTVLQGRLLNADDVAQGRMVAVLNQSTARQLFPGQTCWAEIQRRRRCSP
jgi:putative ABC transport system permease protein